MGNEELTYESATRDVLMALSKLIGEKCVDSNLAFTKCKAESSDPEACLKQGQAVFDCSRTVFASEAGRKVAEELRASMAEPQI